MGYFSSSLFRYGGSVATGCIHSIVFVEESKCQRLTQRETLIIVGFNNAKRSVSFTSERTPAVKLQPVPIS